MGVTTPHHLHPANRHRHDDRSIGQRLADSVTAVFGSWRFIIIQTCIVAVWIAVNILAVFYRWDPYPFILLNLLFSTQAAYAAPLILLSQNRQADTDRINHGEDCHCIHDTEPAPACTACSRAAFAGRDRAWPA